MSMRYQQSEDAVLGTILMHGEALAKVDLEPDDFGDQHRALVFRTIQALALKGDPVDVVTVGECLGGGRAAQFCARLGQAAGSLKTIGAYANNVKMASRKRQARAVAEALINGLQDAQDLSPINQAVTELMGLMTANRRYEFTLNDALKAAVELIDQANERGTAVAISTGLVDLDGCLGGWHDTDLTVIGARPAMGKTALLLNMADACEVPAGIISAEQPHEQLGLRFLALRGKISLHRMRTATLDDNDYAGLSAACALLSNRKVWIYDRSAPDITDVVSYARKWRYEHGIKVLFVDYIQRIRHPESRMQRHEQVAEIVQALKDLARELSIPVVSLSQVSREVEKRTDKHPMMGDLSDSSAIEKEADQILTLYRDEVYKEDTDRKGIADILVCKNRHGPTGIINATWVGEYLRFYDLAKGHPHDQAGAA